MSWISPGFDYRPQKPLFMCVISNTQVGKIPGVSAAGTSPNLTFYTPGADAELVETNCIMTMPELPETPGGSPTPAIVTRAALTLARIDTLFVASGLEKKPAVPFVELGGVPGADIRTDPAVPDARSIYNRAVLLGRKLAARSDCIFIGESIAGGTTTAQAVLKAMGLPGHVSSTFVENPLSLKMDIVNRAMERCGIADGGFLDDPMRAVEQLGDPMMPAALGLMKGLSGTKVVMCGGTQMAAVLAAARCMGIEGDFSIATTKYIAEDRSASFLKIVEEIGWPCYVADPGLERSRIPVVQIYSKGYVKEGVGAGGAVLAASLYGVTQQQIVEETDRVLMTVKLPDGHKGS